MSDLIERQAVIDWLKYKWNRNADSLFYGIQKLPPAQLDLSEYSDKLWRNAYERGKRDALAERKVGKWINAYPDIEPNPMFMYAICSVCGCEQAISDKLNFCPDCGADMRGD